MRLLLGWAINALVLLALPWVLPGVHLRGLGPALLVALVLGLLNTLIRPLLIVLTLPINLLTLGLFTFVINAALLCLAAWLAPGFAIASFWSALALAVIVAVVNAVVGVALKDA